MYPEERVPWPRCTSRRSGRAIRSSMPCASASCFDEPFDAPDGAARDGRIHGTRLVSRRQRRHHPARARRSRPRRQHARHLRHRSRRQPRHARSVGQVDDVRRVGRHPADHGRRRCAAGKRLRNARLAGRCVPRLSFTRSARKPIRRTRDLPGHSLLDIAQGYVPQRTILSEYHAAGALDRLVHDPSRQVQIHSLRRPAADALRPRRGSFRAQRSRPRSCVRRRDWRMRSSACGPSSIPKRRTNSRAKISAATWRSMAARMRY